MKYLDLSLKTPEENIAYDEALLHFCEKESSLEVLRVWEADSFFSVLGQGNSAHKELLLEKCKANDIKVLRRVSGGGTILQFPGCLNYALVLRIDHWPEQSIPQLNFYPLQVIQTALTATLGLSVQIQGHTDLTLNGKKFSGNAQRKGKSHYLFHGTLMPHIPEKEIALFLAHPSKEPDYRQLREHSDFLCPLPLSVKEIKMILKDAWKAEACESMISDETLRDLVKNKYSRDEWNLKY